MGEGFPFGSGCNKWQSSNYMEQGRAASARTLLFLGSVNLTWWS